MIHVLDRQNPFEVKRILNFLNEFSLTYDLNVDYTVYLEENDKIIATASKEKNIIKCFAIDKNYQNQGLSNTLLTSIRNEMFEQGYISSLVFTKLENRLFFEGMGYKLVAHTDKVILLESGQSIDDKIEGIKKENNIDTSIQSSMIVMNCNPMTDGHLYLINKASSESKQVIVFILQEDKSYFKFSDRINIVKEATKNLKNVLVIPSTNYIISSATFPTYFIKKKDEALDIYTTLDATIIASKFCKILNITKRYMGNEPLDEVTNRYNEITKKIFSKYNILVEIVDRLKIDNNVVSASHVRNLLSEKNFEKIKEIVPDATYNFLVKKYDK